MNPLLKKRRIRSKMEAWMIIILIIGGIAAIGTNIWYFKSSKKPVSTTDANAEQTKRIIKQWKDRDELR